MSYRSKTRSRDNITFIGHQHMSDEGSVKPVVHNSTRRSHGKGTTVKRTVYSGLLAVRIKTKKGLSSKWEFVEQFVVVTSQCLSYYDSPINWAKDDAPKFSVAVSSIQGVQSVDSNAFQEPTVFQVTYCSDVGTLKILYFSSRKMQMVDRQEWLTAIRKVCSRNCYWLTNYHSGIYQRCMWTCCRQHSKTHHGCQKSTLIGQPCIKRENLVFSPASTLKPVESSGRITTDSNLNQTNGSPFTSSRERHLTRLNSKNIGHIEIKNFREQSWFYSDMRQGVAESLLRVHDPGCFLVRQFGISMFLSVQTERYMMHIPIINDIEEYWLAADKERRFGDVIELIEYYKKNDVLGTFLKSFPSKTNLQELWQFDLDDVKLPQEELKKTKCWVMWLGHWLRKDDVVLQKMKKIQGKENAQKGTFRRYTALLMNLDHDNIARVYGMSINEPISYVVSEAGIHGFLDEYLKIQVSLEDEELVAMATDVCRALEYLESQKIVHNEVVVENCIVSENKIVKLTGFQSARYEWNKDMLRITVVNKVQIPAPEARKDGESNAGGFNGTSIKSDVWAFGLLLWLVLLRNEVDLPGRDDILNGQFLNFPEVRTIQMKDIICACMKKEPKERPSFKSLLGHLEFMLEGRKTIYGNFIPDTALKDDVRKHKQGTPEFLRERRRQWRSWFTKANYGTSPLKPQSSLQDGSNPDSSLPCQPSEKHPRICVRRCSSVNDLPLLTNLEEVKALAPKLNKASSEVNVSKSPRELLGVPKCKDNSALADKMFDIIDTDDESSTPASSSGSLPNLVEIEQSAVNQDDGSVGAMNRRKKRSLRSGMFAAHLSLSLDEPAAPLREQVSNESEYSDTGRKLTPTESEGSDESSKGESSNSDSVRQKSTETDDCVCPIRPRRRPILRRSLTEDSQSDPEEFGGVWYMSSRSGRSPSCETTSTETSETFSEREKDRRFSDISSSLDDSKSLDRRRRSSVLLSDLNRALEALERAQTFSIRPSTPDEDREKILQTIREEEEKRLKEIDELSQMILQRVEKAELRAKSAEDARQIAENKLRHAEQKLAEVTKQVDRRKSRDDSKTFTEGFYPLSRKLSLGSKDDKELVRTKHELEAAKKDSEDARRQLTESESKLERLERELAAANAELKRSKRPKFIETESNV
ncbi:uncharacterized protein LOC144440149 [Glandiceps talaboti]